MSHRVLVSASAMAVLVALVSSGAAPATAQTTVPRTAWGQPDLQGIWDFRTITPLQRPEDLAEREFLTEEEAAAREQEAVDRDTRLWNREARRTEAGENVGAYNNFWMDRGIRTIGTRRTSLIVDPPNGRMPPGTAEAATRAEARGESRRAHPADSWLDRSAFDRCILGFNAAPPSPQAATTRTCSSSRLRTTSCWSPRWSTRLASCLSMGERRSAMASDSGRATRAATGRAIRWLSRPRMSTTRDGGEVRPRT